MTDKRTENCLYFLRVPATDEGRSFIKQLKGYLNTDSYTYETRYTGKRPKGTNPVSTLKENAESIRLYVRNKDRPFGANYDVNGHTHRLKVENKELKKDVEALHKELDNSPSYNRLKVENRELKKEIEDHKKYECPPIIDKCDCGCTDNECGKIYKLSPSDCECNHCVSEIDELNNKLDAKQTELWSKENELKLEITAHTMMREERDKLKDERDNPHGKTYELSVSDCECQGCPPKIGECDCRDSLPLIPEYNCHTEINKLKEERDELDKLCMSQQVEIDRLDMKIDNEVCEGSCVSQEDYDEALELKDSMREELKALNKSSADFLRHKLAEAYSSVSDLRDTVRDVQEERDDAIGTSRDLRIQLESVKEEESITHIKHHYLGSIPEDDVLYWMKIGYMLYNKVDGNDVKSNG